MRVLHLLENGTAIVRDQFVTFPQQGNRLFCREVMQEEQAGIHFVQSRLVRAQSLTQQPIEVPATLLSDVVAIAFAQRKLFLSRGGQP